MDQSILQSVIELTQQHDINSLEVSLISSLAELVPANAIFLVSPSAETPDEYFEVVRLSITNGAGCEQQYKWAHEPRLCAQSMELQKCFNNKTPVQQSMGNGSTQFLFPVTQDTRTSQVLGVETSQGLNTWQPIIEAFTKIYGNYLTILHISERDKLTDLHNRRTFDYKLEKLLKVQRLKYVQYGNSQDNNEKRRTHPDAHSWLAMLDIDHFKRINDTYGHLFGDEVILILSQQMKRFFRTADLLFRFGGEEFVIILAPLPPDKAHQTLERFRESIARYNIPQVGNITISIGYTNIIDGVFSHITLDHADKALYFAKEHGRNCVYNYEELIENGSLSDHKKSNVTLFSDD